MVKYLANHLTKSGIVGLTYEWGHGKGTHPNTSTPATLVTDDGDGHYGQWHYTGKLEDALATLAPLFRRDDKIVVRDGHGLRVDCVPDDFWICDPETDDATADLEKYPDVLAY